MLIKSVQIIKSIGPLKKGLEIQFEKPVTILTGDQGTGKSLLLSLIARKDVSNPERYVQIEAWEKGKNGLIYRFDSEHENPRIEDLDFLSMEAVAYGINARREQSHGQAIAFILNGLIKIQKKNDLLLLDEPESGLSLRNMSQLIAKIRKMRSQVIMVSHHPWLLEEFSESVYDMKTKNFINPVEYMIKIRKREKNVLAT